MSRDGFFVDFSNYRDRSSAHLPEGVYLVRVTDAELVETKKGDPMVNLFYEVVGGAFAGSPLIDRLVLTEKALWRVAKVLRALGFKVEKRNMNIPFKQTLGRTLAITVSDGEPYNGEVRSEIRDYAPAASVKPEESAPIHQDGEPHTIGTAESEGPLGDEIRAANAEDTFTQEKATEERGEIEVPGNGEVTL